MIPNLRYRSTDVCEMNGFLENDVVIDISNTNELRWFLIDTITKSRVKVRRIKVDGEVTLIPVFLNAEDFMKRMRKDPIATSLLNKIQEPRNSVSCNFDM